MAEADRQAWLPREPRVLPRQELLALRALLALAASRQPLEARQASPASGEPAARAPEASLHQPLAAFPQRRRKMRRESRQAYRPGADDRAAFRQNRWS